MSNSIQLLTESVRGANLNMYECNQRYDFTNKTTLRRELIRPTVTIEDIIKWELQLMQCFRYEYITYNECPEHPDPKCIMVDNNKDIIHHSVVFSRTSNNIAYDAKYTDCLIRIHCSLFQYIRVGKNKIYKSKELDILFILGTYFYAAIGSVSHRTTVAQTCSLIESFSEMIELGIIDKLIQLFNN